MILEIVKEAKLARYLSAKDLKHQSWIKESK